MAEKKKQLVLKKNTPLFDLGHGGGDQVEKVCLLDLLHLLLKAGNNLAERAGKSPLTNHGGLKGLGKFGWKLLGGLLHLADHPLKLLAHHLGSLVLLLDLLQRAEEVSKRGLEGDPGILSFNIIKQFGSIHNHGVQDLHKDVDFVSGVVNVVQLRLCFCNK